MCGKLHSSRSWGFQSPPAGLDLDDAVPPVSPNVPWAMSGWGRDVFTINSLKFNIAPEKLPSNRKGSSSNHHFSGAM